MSAYKILALTLIAHLVPLQKAPVPVTKVIISCACEDSVGKGYARALRDEVAKSPRYEEVADTKTNRSSSVLVSVVTLAVDDDSQGSASTAAISVVFAINDIFLNQLVQSCGVSATTGCARKTMNALDETVSEVKAAAS